MKSDKVTIVDSLETEIVIIGGGGAGLAAAVAATEKGANVIVLEKRGTLGGISAMAQGFFAVESPVQQRMRLDLRRDELFKIAMEYSHWEINPRIVRAFVDKSGDTVRWLEEMGIEFDLIPFFYLHQVHPVYHVPKGGGGGAAIVRALAEKCKKRDIRLLTKTAAKKILIGEKGNVTGVLAITEDKEFRINAKSAIIATGGYGGNKELMKKYYSSYTEDLLYFGAPHMTGDGLLMAIEIGANTEGLGILLLHGPAPPSPILELWAVALEPYTVWVNKNGERFIDEDTPLCPTETANALDRQAGKVSYHLFDEKMKQSMIREGIIEGAGPAVLARTRLTNLEEKLRLEANKGWVKISDSWENIARWIGAAPEILKSTIDEYNYFCDKGYDEIFNKDRRYLLPLRTPPYYAMKLTQAFLDTIGGIKINHHMEVLNHQDNLIPGLYAAGVTTGGWESKTYCIVFTGKAFGFALNSGRIAGENAAEYVSRK